MASTGSVDAGFFKKTATRFLVKIRHQSWLQRFLPDEGDVFHMFGLFIKVQHSEHLGEAHSMRFLAEHTSIPVPKVHCAFTHDDQTYTVMSRIKGQTLCEAWPDLSQAAKDKIFIQLKGFIAELRQITRPGSDTGVSGINGGPIRDFRLPGQIIKGPFKTIDEFHQALVVGFDFRNDLHPLLRYPEINELLEFYRQAQYDIVFTHGDLSSLNIMVSGDTVTGIIDWETAGWYPSYWEYTMAKAVNPYNTFWEAEIEHFMTPLPHELAMDKIRLRYFNWYGMD